MQRSVAKATAYVTRAELRSVPDLKSTKTIYMSQLLSKFSLFVPSIKNSIQNLQNYTVNIQTGINKILNLLTIVKNKMATYVNLKTKIVVELRQIKQTLQTEPELVKMPNAKDDCSCISY